MDNPICNHGTFPEEVAPKYFKTTCEREAVTLGLCSRHYQWFRRNNREGLDRRHLAKIEARRLARTQV
jgi:hypothetical protein